MKKICINCKFYDSEERICRRNAPNRAIMPASATYENKAIEIYCKHLWPAVGPTDWCGDFQPVRSAKE